jgi:hypothetical protein
MEIRSAIVELLHAYRRTDSAILIGAPRGCERARKELKTIYISVHKQENIM